MLLKRCMKCDSVVQLLSAQIYHQIATKAKYKKQKPSNCLCPLSTPIVTDTWPLVSFISFPKMLQGCLSILGHLNFGGTEVKISKTLQPPHLFIFACRKTCLCRRRSGPDGVIHIFDSHPAELHFEICCRLQGR